MEGKLKMNNKKTGKMVTKHFQFCDKKLISYKISVQSPILLLFHINCLIFFFKLEPSNNESKRLLQPSEFLHHLL